jgi:hypothetical protein
MKVFRQMTDFVYKNGSDHGGRHVCSSSKISILRVTGADDGNRVSKWLIMNEAGFN